MQTCQLEDLQTNYKGKVAEQVRRIDGRPSALAISPTIRLLSSGPVHPTTVAVPNQAKLQTVDLSAMATKGVKNRMKAKGGPAPVRLHMSLPIPTLTRRVAGYLISIHKFSSW